MKVKSRVLPLAAALLGLAPAVSSAAPIDFHGYFRSGVGTTSEGGDQVCFQLPGAPKKYRLGNECETYGELSLSAEAYKAPSGTTFKLSTMAAFALPNQLDWEQFSPSWREVFVEAQKIGTGAFANASIWAGKRYYDRHDVHINDFYFWSNSGPGFGIENVDLGFSKFSYAFRRNGEAAGIFSASDRQLISHDIRFKDIPTNKDGSITVGLDIRHENSADKFNPAAGVAGEYQNPNNPDGQGLTVMHTQNNILNGGFNKLAFQYGKGAVANLDHSFPNFSANEDDKAWRIVETFVWQPSASSNWSGMATAVYENRDFSTAAASGSWLSFGARPVYHFSDQWSLATEFGHDSFKPDAGSKQSLNKLTVAAQFGSGRNFWARPVIRAFYTYAKWNGGAQTASAAGSAMSSTGVFGSETNGSTAGVQAEVWW